MLGRRSQNNSATPTATPSGALETLIGRRTEFKGDIDFNGGLRVDGKIKGNVRASGSGETSLVVSESGQVEGNVDVTNVVINGVVNGNVNSSGKVELQAGRPWVARRWIRRARREWPTCDMLAEVEGPAGLADTSLSGRS